jgi:hypothetical protein
MVENTAIPEFQIAKLSLAPGDILVVRLARLPQTPEDMDRISKYLRRSIPAANNVLIIDQGCELSVLTVDQLAQIKAA